MPRPRKIFAVDAETDPFKHLRIPLPFVWGSFDGKTYRHFFSTEEFVKFHADKHAILYAHNGGKFDFMYLLPFIRETKAQIINGRVVAMFLGAAELRDSFAIMPEGLGKLGDKMEFDYWKLEADVRHKYMPEILEYLERDCRVLFDVVTTYRAKVGTQKTIASNALRFAKKLGIKPGRTNHRFDKKYRPFFFGGRTEVFLPGSHENINIFDINSCYPFAMMQDHATGSQLERGVKLEAMTREQQQRAFIILECYSAGAFPHKRIGPGGGLSFPHAHGEYYVTGWEYVAAKELGLIHSERIISVRSTEAKINFRDYVLHWYQMKKDNPKHVNLLNYMIAKYMMNSLYGKMAQDIRHYFDYRIVSAGTPICHEFRPQGDWQDNGTYKINYDERCRLCRQDDNRALSHGWLLFTEDRDRDVHRRPSLWKWNFEKGENWEGENLFHNVATGASITGFARAHLLRAMHAGGAQHVIYTDTDSLITTQAFDVSNLQISKELGDWNLEVENAPLGHFAGKKLYGIKLPGDAPCSCLSGKGCKAHKIASKGSKLAFHDIKDIVDGKTVTWRSEAPTYSLKKPPQPGHEIDVEDYFLVREIRNTAARR